MDNHQEISTNPNSRKEEARQFNDRVNADVQSKVAQAPTGVNPANKAANETDDASKKSGSFSSFNPKGSISSITSKASNTTKNISGGVSSFKPRINLPASIQSKISSQKNSVSGPSNGSTMATAVPPSTSKEALPPLPPQKVSIRDKTTFSWQNVGVWDYASTTDKAKALKNSKNVETYVTDHFYGDWYWNCSLIIGTCFFSWLVARIGGGILSLLVVLLFTNSIYRSEFRRFNRDIRDDMVRINAGNRLENEIETMEWMNSFLDKFWVIYMPAFSEMVMLTANGILKDLAPGYGIDKLTLDEFTLGSKAPRIHSIKSYTKKGDDIAEMDWTFSFTPNDTDGMTKAEIKKKIDPKVALGVTVGKAFISKTLPILVEDMSMTGRLKIKMKLFSNFPHIKMVSLQFLEAPTIDYKFKPMGGDTLGIDIMSLIPGLSTVVNGVIHSILRPMFYAPNHFDIDVEQIMAAQSNDSVGVVAVTIKRLTKLKNGNPTKPNSINPYVQLKIFNNAKINEKTSVKKLINDPIFNETKYLLVNKLDGNHLNFNVFHLLEDKADDQLIGNLDFPLGDLLQEEIHTDVVKTLTESGKAAGKIEFDIRYFPTIPPHILEDGTKEAILDTEVGILKLNLHEARDLDISKSALGLLNPYSEIYINDELLKTGRRLRGTNEPSWGEGFETLITQQSETNVRVLIKDSVEENVVATLDANLQDLVFETSRGQDWIEGKAFSPDDPKPKFRITADWKALSIPDHSLVKTHENASIGGIKLQLHSAKGLKNLEAVGLVDPYVRVLLNGKLRAKTAVHENTLDPEFNGVYFLPVANEHQHFLLQIMDAEPEGKDRPLGTAAVNVSDFLKKDEKGYWLPHDGSNEIIEQPVIFGGQPSGKLYFSVSFFPTIPVYSLSQIQNKEAYLQQQKEKEEAEIAQREADEKLFKEKPHEYEWVEVDELHVDEPEKINIPFEEAIKYRAGNVVVHVLSGKFDTGDIFVHTLFDEQAYSSGVTPKADGRVLNVPSHAEGFIRDLPESKLIFRISKVAEILHQSDILSEIIYPTFDILKKSHDKPITLRIPERNQIVVQLEYIPSNAKLNPLDTVLDVGKLRLDVVGAENLKSMDTNGKSDPLCVVRLDGVEVYKTDKKKKNLNPVWNEAVEINMFSRSNQNLVVEVYDWDLTHDDRLIGAGKVDLSTIDPPKTSSLTVPLDSQGAVHLKASFSPEYIRPRLEDKVKVTDMDSLTGAPRKVVGSASDAATTVVGGAAGVVGGTAGVVVGGGLGLASEGLSKSTSILKGFHRSSKSSKRKSQIGEGSHEKNGSVNTTTSSADATVPDTTSEYSDDQSHVSIASPSSPSKGRDSNQKSQYANDLQSLRSGKGTATNHLPNHENLQPPTAIPGHVRNVSDTGSIASSINPGAIPGRISIVSASGFSTEKVDVRTVLKTPTKEKEVFKTRSTKIDKATGAYKWNESSSFKSVIDGELQFEVREHHTFGKSATIGQAVLPLHDAANRPDNIELSAGPGKLLVHVKYTTE
ncbi:putative bud/polarization protein [Scheffersomyces xylosifermentans]|uniref:putative bud/polarization protein n=1 Tax=Scheffersomyces xylosifermentans TaxID=1304137 RepID=UPI00315D596C